MSEPWGENLAAGQGFRCLKITGRFFLFPKRHLFFYSIWRPRKQKGDNKQMEGEKEGDD